MAKKGTIRDPVLGELTWDEASQEWQGEIYFTPKHPVALSFYAAQTFRTSSEQEIALARGRSAYLAQRPREWEYRLAVAETVIDAVQHNPRIEEEIGSLDEAASVARRVILTEIALYPGSDSLWLLRVARPDGITVLLHLKEDGTVVLIEF